MTNTKKTKADLLKDLETLRLESETLKGTSVLSIVAPEYRNEFAELAERVLEGNSGHLEFEVIGLKGIRRRLQTQAVPM